MSIDKEPEELSKHVVYITAIYWSILNSSQGQLHFPAATIIVFWTFILTVNEIQLRELY